MGFWSSVSSFVSSVSSAISSAVSNLGSAISSAATKIAELGVDLAQRVGETIRAIATGLGVLSPKDNLQELGEKALMCDKKPEDFDSFNDYINHLRTEVSIDKEKFAALDEKELLARAAIGASITLKGINEKLDMAITPEFLATVAKQELETEEIMATIHAYKDSGLKVDDYNRYINNELSLDDSSKHANTLVEAYRKLEPDLSIEQIEDKVMGLK
ncbi:hypothetical protein [Ferrimonas senticii]|uniref:hypothetical protein n=1 Tax=Ferrimonas senticii TaxID=394566 RepID=UPI000402DC32|nr:hypothetical protein [Ferrimonas senticii]